jgi:hypothetical protein
MSIEFCEDTARHPDEERSDPNTLWRNAVSNNTSPNTRLIFYNWFSFQLHLNRPFLSWVYIFLAREVGGTLDAEIAKGKSRTDILITSRDAIARLVRRGANTTPPAVRLEREELFMERAPARRARARALAAPRNV